MRNRNHVLAIEHCVFCGRPLERHEGCDCMMPLPKDGLRAVCEHFKARSTYYGTSYISCHKKIRFENRLSRDGHYMKYCCGNCRSCPIYSADDEKRQR